MMLCSRDFCDPDPQKPEPSEVSSPLPYSPPLEPPEEIRRPEVTKREPPGHQLQGTQSWSFLYVPFPYDSIRARRSKQGVMENTVNMGPEDLSTNPSTPLHSLTVDKSGNLSCFPLPIREFATSIPLTGWPERVRTARL